MSERASPISINSEGIEWRIENLGEEREKEGKGMNEVPSLHTLTVQV